MKRGCVMDYLSIYRKVVQKQHEGTLIHLFKEKQAQQQEERRKRFDELTKRH